jgi:zinc transport system ATP-binding protein
LSDSGPYQQQPPRPAGETAGSNPKGDARTGDAPPEHRTDRLDIDRTNRKAGRSTGAAESSMTSNGAAPDSSTAFARSERAAATVAELDSAVVVLGGRVVLRRVSAEVTDGEVVAVLGANGSGKSTLVRALIGLVPLRDGEARLFGSPLPRFKEWRRIGYVPQRTTAAAGVPATVREVVTSGRLAYTGVLGRLGKSDRAAIDEALATVGLTDRTGDSVARLSGGQQQRVLIARALATRPDLLILDEPMAGVDLANQRALADTLAGLHADGTTILLVLHELGPLAPLIDRAVVLRDGRVVHDGAPPPAVGHHADPAHDHLHPHAPAEEPGWLR